MLRAFFLVCVTASFDGEAQAMASIPEGRFAPLFGLDVGQQAFPVGAFRVDVRPVSRARFADFLAANAQWSKERAPKALVDAAYLEGFDPKTHPDAPVTGVSYFAARAFCAWRGGRLPTTLEWEYVAAADETRRDASREADFARRILDWYGRPNRADDLLQAGSPRNVYGVEALHGLVWEWTEDFNGLFVTGDNRQDGDRDPKAMCGAGATGSARREDYAAFMRYAMRSSLTPRSSLPRLGFRCVVDERKGGP